MVPAALASVVLVTDPDPIDASAAALIAVGLMVATVTALSGLLLARAPWGRWGLAASAILSMMLISVSSGPLVYAVYIIGAVALVGVLGPWLQLWVRHQTLAEAPGPVPIALTSAAAVAPLYIGLAAAGGAELVHWALALTVVATSVAYGRGLKLGLWGFRIVVPAMTAVTALASEPVGAAILLIGGAALTLLSWLPAAKRTTTMITPPLPSPVRRSP